MCTYPLPCPACGPIPASDGATVADRALTVPADAPALASAIHDLLDLLTDHLPPCDEDCQPSCVVCNARNIYRTVRDLGRARATHTLDAEGICLDCENDRERKGENG
jgi:hypothetical protein